MMRMIVAGLTEILVSFNANLHTDPGIGEEVETKAWLVFIAFFAILSGGIHLSWVN